MTNSPKDTQNISQSDHEAFATTEGNSSEKAIINLTGKILIAMPGMTDPRFERSVILVCTHTEDGAMGLVLNKPMPEVDFGNLLEQLDIDSPDGAQHRIEIRFGGPVEPGRGFVLHKVPEHGHDPEGRLRIGGSLAMTTTRDILEDLANGRGPEAAVLALGYSGWGPGQLEAEIQQNGWLTGDGADDLVFGTDHSEKWQAALRAQGVDPSLLSGAAGHA